MAFTEIFSQILNNSNPEEASLASIQKLLLNSISERDISAQETCHLLLSIPLYHSSRTFVSLNLKDEAARWIRGTGSRNNEEGFTNVRNAGHTAKSAINKYWNRPKELEEFSLFKLYLIHKNVGEKWKICKKENIVRIWLQPLPLHNGDQ